MKKILHIAVENFAGLPFALVKAERAKGYDSHLVTMYQTFQRFPEEYCLDLPFVQSSFARFVRKIFGNTGTLSTKRRISQERPPIFRYKNFISKGLFGIRDFVWKDIVSRSVLPSLMENADIVILDGGLGITRSGDMISDWVSKGGKLIEIFYGTDLRTRGIIEQIDKIAALRFTLEFDHLELYPGINFLYFPFDSSNLPKTIENTSGVIRIGHSPTKRETKGSKFIIEAVSELSKTLPVELVLIEGLPFSEAIQKKASCDIFIDQLGDLGYGISALEALAMGIPTMVELKEDFEDFLGEHPFINVNKDNLQKKLTDLLKNKEKIKRLARFGIGWVESRHSVENTSSRIFEEMGNLHWLEEIQ